MPPETPYYYFSIIKVVGIALAAAAAPLKIGGLVISHELELEVSFICQTVGPGKMKINHILYP